MGASSRKAQEAIEAAGREGAAGRWEAEIRTLTTALAQLADDMRSAADEAIRAERTRQLDRTADARGEPDAHAH